jgi:hypothetical protein
VEKALEKSGAFLSSIYISPRIPIMVCKDFLHTSQVNDGKNLTFYLQKSRKNINFKQLKINKNGSNKKSSKRV